MKQPEYTAQQLRNAVVKAAMAEHKRVVKDVQEGHVATPHAIADYYREVGGWWTTYLDKYGDGSYKEVFVVNGERRFMSWCGVFVGWCGIHVGDYIASNQCVPVQMHPALAQQVMPSTYRLSRNGKWQAAIDTDRPKVDKADIQRGDIVVVGHDKSYGDHITLALEKPKSRAGKIKTVSGNVSNAKLGDGTVGEGVGIKEYTLEDVNSVYRLPKAAFFRHEV